MSDSTYSGVSNDAESGLSRTPSEQPAVFDLRISIATPTTIRTNIEASEARSRKRKALSELAGDAADKKLKTTGASPVKDKGGRPKKEKPTPPRQPKGTLRLRTSKPVKAFLPPELWKLVFEQSSPALLLRARTLNRNFYYGLTNGSEQSTWITARKLTYGSDHPDPPAGIDEIQYADLLEGQGCQGCKNTKTRKTYWAFLRRWCESCLNENVIPEEDANAMMSLYTGWRPCVSQAVRDSWNHYQWAGTSEQRPDWAKYQKHAHLIFLKSGPEGLNALKAKIDAFMQTDTGRTTRTPADIEKFMDAMREDMEKKMAQRRKVEDWEGNRRQEHRGQTRDVIRNRTDSIFEKAAKMTPPIQRVDLVKLQAFKNAIAIPKPLTIRSWQELEPKLINQLGELREEEARAAEQEEKARIQREEANRKVMEARLVEQHRVDRLNSHFDRKTAVHIRFGLGGHSDHNSATNSGIDSMYCFRDSANGASAFCLSNARSIGYDTTQSNISNSFDGGNNNGLLTSIHRHLPPLDRLWGQRS